MAGVRIFTVHVNPAKTQAYESAEFVREGFSWAGFVFAGAWMLYHRLWFWSVIVISGNATLWWLQHVKLLSHPGYLVVHTAVHLLVGWYGNDWRRDKLKHQGYITADIVSGDSLLNAELRFFDRYFERQAAAKAW